MPDKVAPAQTAEISEITNKNVLQYYLDISSKAIADWTQEHDKFISKVKESKIDERNRTISLTHSIQITATSNKKL